MKKLLLLTTASMALVTVPALADPVVLPGYDPLHFSCSNCGADNGTLTPVQAGQEPTGITVTESGTNGGLVSTDFILKVLIPLNFSSSPEAVTGTLGASPFSGAANLFTSATQGTMWTSGSLETDFLGFATAQGGSPPNPIGAFLPSTTAVDPLDTTGFFVLTLDLGGVTIPQQGQPGVSPFSLDLANLPVGSWVLGDAFSTDCGNNGPAVCDITTAQSAALFVSPAAVPGPIAGAGIPGIVAGALSLLALARRRFNWLRA